MKLLVPCEKNVLDKRNHDENSATCDEKMNGTEKREGNQPEGKLFRKPEVVTSPPPLASVSAFFLSLP